MNRQTLLHNQLAHWDASIRDRLGDPEGYIRRGMVYFKLAQIPESIRDFDRAEALDPRVKPYLWQRGLSYYYAGEFQAGADQFEIDLTVNARDVEETVWRYLCIARLRGAQVAQNTLLPVGPDPRRVMRQIYTLFQGNCTPDEAITAGAWGGRKGRFYAHLYVGLYHEATGDELRSRHFITRAATQYQVNDYMWDLAVVHCQLRGWN
ncbi:MAG: tetratricopeptide repeat protein [Limnospira sp.]